MCLECTEDAIRCCGCGRLFELFDEIPLLTHQREYRYNFTTVAPGELDSLFAKSDMTEWSTLLTTFLVSAAKRYRSPSNTHSSKDTLRKLWYVLRGVSMEPILTNILDESRLASIVLLSENLRSDSIVLDLGCGYGAISTGLAPFADRVYSMDLSLEKIRFVKMRARAENRQNIIVCFGGNTPYLPFSDAFFDLVILNGVLEWVPTSITGDKPQVVQSRFLSEIRRVLKNTGEVIIGIENRHSWIDLIGFPEGHVGVPFIGLLPRPLADLLLRRLRGHELRVYTHSKPAYKRLLRSVGFRDHKFVVPLPSYRVVRSLASSDFKLPLDVEVGYNLASPRYTHSSLLRGVTKFVLHAATRLFPPTFLIFVKKGLSGDRQPRRRMIDIILSQIMASGAVKGAGEIKKLYIRNGVIIALIGSSKLSQPSVVIRLPLTTRALEGVKRNYETLVWLQSMAGEGKIDQRFPLPLFQERFEGITFFCESVLPGSSAVKIVNDSRLFANLFSEVLSLLKQWRDLSGLTSTKLGDEQVVSLFTVLIKDVAEKLSPERKQVLLRLSDDIEKLIGRNSKETIDLGWTHNDLSLSNLIIDSIALKRHRRVSLKGIIDYEASDFNGSLATDLVFLLASRIRNLQGISLGSAFGVILNRSVFLSERYIWGRETGFDESLFVLFVTLAWLKYLYSHKSTAAIYSNWWLEKHFDTFADSFFKWY